MPYLLPPAAFAFSTQGGAVSTDVSLSLEAVERMHIERVLRHHDGRVEPAAQTLGISRASLYEKIRRYDLAATRKGSPESRNQS